MYKQQLIQNVHRDVFQSRTGLSVSSLSKFRTKQRILQGHEHKTPVGGARYIWDKVKDNFFCVPPMTDKCIRSPVHTRYRISNTLSILRTKTAHIIGPTRYIVKSTAYAITMHTGDDSFCFGKKGVNYYVTLFNELRQTDHLTRHLASGAMRATLGRPHFVTLLCAIRGNQRGRDTNEW